jgi:hypothetical protein
LNIRDAFAVGRVTDFWNVLREVDPQHVVRESEQPVRVVICGSPGVGKRTLAAALTGHAISDSGIAVDVCDMDDGIPTALPTADLYVYVASVDTPLGALHRSHIGQLVRRPGKLICALNQPMQTDVKGSVHLQQAVGEALGITPERIFCMSALDRERIQRSLVPGLIRAVPHLALPMGRCLPLARDSAADQLIRDTARVNAEFAVVSSLPALIPVVGTAASLGTDMVVLTKNQVMLTLKLALLHRRSIDNRVQVLAEIAPVVGAAFLWRSAARALVSLLPGPLGVAPRGGIAFVGTYVAGKAGQYYYRSGLRPSPEILGGFRDEALHQLAEVLPLLGEFGRRLRFP